MGRYECGYQGLGSEDDDGADDLGGMAQIAFAGQQWKAEDGN